MFTTRGAKALLAGVLICSALPGCGGSIARRIVPPGPSKTEFVRRANALCNEQARTHRIRLLYSNGGLEVPLLGRVAFDIARKELSQLRALAEPKKDRGYLADIWAERSTQLNDIFTSSKLFTTGIENAFGYAKHKIAAVPRYPEARVRRLAFAGFKAANRYVTLANKFGMSACALLQPKPEGPTKLVCHQTCRYTGG